MQLKQVHILCQYKSVYLYCMLFLSLWYAFMLLPQPVLHNAYTDETDTTVKIFQVTTVV